MATIIIVLFILAIYHLVMDSIIFPSCRFEIRYKLFALRDRLREMKLVDESKIDDQTFSFVDGSLSTALQMLPYINLTFLFALKNHVEKNSQLKKEIEGRATMIASCEVKEVKEITKKRDKLVLLGLVANIGGWLIYILPIILLTIVLAELRSILLSKIGNVSYTPDREVSRLIPGNTLLPAY